MVTATRNGAVRSGRNRGLDGLRGIAVLLVVASHGVESWIPYGGVVGVTMFFVLSGYLITLTLLAEHDRTGRISLRRFVVRRAARLLPALLVVVVAAIALAWALHDDTQSRAWLRGVLAVTYVADYARAFGVELGFLEHTWSLAVEEHFYVVWPLVLLGLLALGARRPRLSAVLLIGLLAVAIAWRVVATVHLPYAWVAYSFDTSGYALLLGCVVAVVSRTRTLTWLRRPSVGWVALVALGCLAVCTVPWSRGPVGRVGLWVELAAAVIVASALGSIAAGHVGVLRARWVGWIGTVSYGFYLWHYVLLSVRPDGVEQQGVARVVPVLIALGLAAVSWYALERPVLAAVRKPLSKRHTDTAIPNAIQ